MKNTFLHLSRLMTFVGIFFVTVLLQSSSCSKDDVPGTGTTTGVNGAWKVSYYFDTGDETSNFAGYSFTFNNGGTVSATNAGITVNGTWSQTSSKFIINFAATSVLNDLNDDWLIVEKTDVSIKLKEDNPAQDDQLHFTKL
jgi:hypothetical protein